MTTRPAPTAWYRRTFDRLYPLLYQHRDDASAQREVAALQSWAGLPTDGTILDIACGAGRHLRALRDAGYHAIGVDLSGALLTEAVHQRGLGGAVMRADVRRLPFDRCMAGATNLFTSFGYFPTDAQNTAAMQSIAHTLQPGGVFVFDHANRAYVESTLVLEDVKTIEGLTIASTRHIADHRVVKQMVVTDEQGQTETLEESVRLYGPGEVEALFDQAGMDVVRLAGGFDGSPFTEMTDRMIVIGCKR